MLVNQMMLINRAPRIAFNITAEQINYTFLCFGSPVKPRNFQWHPMHLLLLLFLSFFSLLKCTSTVPLLTMAAGRVVMLPSMVVVMLLAQWVSLASFFAGNFFFFFFGLYRGWSHIME